jgi:hypothetical protein
MLSGGCLLNQVSRRSMFELQADCANSRCSIRMPPRRVNKGAFGKGNQGYGLRNAAVDAADEPDAGARANECPPVALAHAHTRHTRVHTHTHTRTHAHAHTHTHSHTLTHTRALALQTTHAHEPARTRSRARTLKHAQCHSESLARSRAHAPAHPARRNTRVQTSCYSSASSSRHKA